ncbi:unnamed protein product [Taenia asiatica]|uniref:26S proteasome non-ATPase regulatory subunit 13 n=1 Tax=Taenia asiatica TaxID=60517 RepID=A0A0R3W5D5_TAEAS|nr:unnamed protein product [Taenia asiatica]
MEYLDARIKNSKSFKDDWTQIRDLYSRKLWHQLTLQVLESLNKPGFTASLDLNEVAEVIELINMIYNDRINPLSLAEILVPMSNEMVAKDPHSTIKFLEENRDKYMSMNDEALILAQSAIGMVRLLVLQDLPGARDIIEATGDILSKIDGVTPVHSRYYRMSSQYFKLMGQHAEYYQEALRFLGCTDLSELSESEKQDWAFSVGLAALLGRNVYNFGELISHEILETLRSKPDVAWLVDMLHAFNKGDLDTIMRLRPQWSAVKDLAEACELLQEKAVLLALMEMFFRRPPNQRTVSFADIAAATKLPLDKVEGIVMRALSLNLMKGRIDEVNQKVTLTWLQPRVLDLDQITSMADRLTEWQKSVTAVRDLVSVDAKKLLV